IIFRRDEVEASLSGNSPICNGNASQLAVNFTGSTSPYEIDIDNGVGTINNYNSDDPITVNPTTTTLYSLLSATDSEGCPASIVDSSFEIEVNNPPTGAVLSLVGPNDICDGESSSIKIDITGGASQYEVVYTDGVSNYTENNYIS